MGIRTRVRSGSTQEPQIPIVVVRRDDYGFTRVGVTVLVAIFGGNGW
jgi:hypothetical protein